MGKLGAGKTEGRENRWALGVYEPAKRGLICRCTFLVLTQYEQVVSSVPKRLGDLATGVKVAVEAYKPDAE